MMKKILAVIGAVVVIVPLLGLLVLFAGLVPPWAVVGAFGVFSSVVFLIFRRRSSGGSELSFLGANRPAKEGLL